MLDFRELGVGAGDDHLEEDGDGAGEGLGYEVGLEGGVVGFGGRGGGGVHVHFHGVLDACISTLFVEVVDCVLVVCDSRL